MERAVIALLCLSAAFCLASGQNPLPQCPDDWLTNFAKYQRSNYAQPSRNLLIDQECSYEIQLSFGVYGLTPTISICRPGTVSLQIGNSPVGGIYICQPVGPVAPGDSVNDVAPVAPVADTEPPRAGLVVPPIEAVVRPAPGGISECPEGGISNRNQYVFSSLSLIEEIACFIRTRVNGSPGQQRSRVWECKAGYTREFVRRNQFRCVQ